MEGTLRVSHRAGKTLVNSEVERQYRVVDQLVSMHSMLRDRYSRLALALNTLLVVVSFALCVMTFVGDEVLKDAGQNPPFARLVFGLVAAVILALAITEFRVDWRARSALHADAAKRLSEVKGEYRRVRADSVHVATGETRRLSRLYETTLQDVVEVPERMFNRLKVKHVFKRILSEETSAYPKAPHWFLWMRLRWEGIVGAWRGEPRATKRKGNKHDD